MQFLIVSEVINIKLCPRRIYFFFFMTDADVLWPEQYLSLLLEKCHQSTYTHLKVYYAH